MLKTIALICMLLALNGKRSDAPFYRGKHDDDDQGIVSISILPSNPLIEKDQYGQYLNFDIIIKNTSGHTLDLQAINASVMDASAKLLLKRSINSNGRAPGIKTIGNTIIKPGETIDIFNPFYNITPDLKIAYLQYEFLFNYADSPQQAEANRHRLPMDFDASIVKVITPRSYVSKTNFILPLKGKLLVWDGHDFFYRRVALGLPNGQEKIITANSNRYAYDLVSIDEKGSMYQDDPFKKENWFIYGKPVYAPAGGIIVEAQNSIPDNEYSGKMVKPANIPRDADPQGMGNYVIIDHGNGEFSALLHLKKGSLTVRNGMQVRAGQQLGNIGFSGDAIFPHLHYTVMSGPKEQAAEGVPSYFNNYKMYRGNNIVLIKKGRIDSGDIVESGN